MKYQYIRLFIKLFCFSYFTINIHGFCLLSQEISLTPIGQKKIGLIENEKDSIDYSSFKWIEKTEERTEFSSTFVTEDGWVKIESSHQPIHRKIKGKCEKIDPSMIQLDNHSWHSPNQDYPVYLDANSSFSLTTENQKTWTFGLTTKLQSTEQQLSYLTRSGNEFYFSFSDYPIVKEVRALNNGVKYNYRINSNLEIDTENLVFSELIQLPKGFVLSEFSQLQETFWGNFLVKYFEVKDDSGQVHGRIDPAYAIDSDGESIPANYNLISLGEGKYELQISLSNSWLSSGDRAYPVILDPLVAGPISQWTGGQMPSCMSPQQNIDSILVTIPAGVTPVSLAVRSSFYADPWTNATMSMGAMQFSTSCNATQLYQIQGADGNLPGTAYLDSANMMNPLLCCFPQSCSNQQFYLRKHLSRTAPGTGCNATFIRYDPFTTQWPFRAIVYGRTPETYAAEWSTPQLPRCSDNCDFNASAYVRYGVPPFTFTHPWQDTIIVEGTPTGCGTGQTNVQFQLTIPDCPIYCDENYTTLPVPSPTVTDACGVTLNQFPLKNLTIKPTPQISPMIDTIYCAGENIEFTFSNCLSEGETNWSAGELSGTNTVSINTDPNLGGTFTYNFLVTSTVNGCEAEPYFQPVYVFPLPNVSFSVSSENTFLGDLIDFQNTSTGVSIEGNDWIWSYGDSTTQIAIHGQHTYTDVGTFQVCLSLFGGDACANSYCEWIPVVPNSISVPNVFTPNGDGSNDVLNLFFDWAEKVELLVQNRWGNKLAEITIQDYDSGWNGKMNNSGEDLPDGVYFYSYEITTTVGGTLSGHSFVHLVRD